MECRRDPDVFRPQRAGATRTSLVDPLRDGKREFSWFLAVTVSCSRGEPLCHRLEDSPRRLILTAYLQQDGAIRSRITACELPEG